MKGQVVVFFGVAIIAGFSYGAQGRTSTIFYHLFGHSDPTELIHQLASEEPNREDLSDTGVASSVIYRLNKFDEQITAQDGEVFRANTTQPTPPAAKGAAQVGTATTQKSALTLEPKQQESQQQARFKLATAEPATPPAAPENTQMVKELRGVQTRLQGENDRLKDSVSTLTQQLSSLQRQQGEIAKGRDANSVRISSLEMENETLRKQLSETKEALSSAKMQSTEKLSQLESSSGDLERARKELSLLQSRIDQVEADLKTAQQERDSLTQKVALENERSKELPQITAELEATKQLVTKKDEELAAARTVQEANVQCQDNLLRAKNDLVLARTELSTLTAVINRTPTQATPTRTVMGVATQEPPLKSDVLVVQVAVPKANLRSGPGEEHSSVMEIAGGSRLTVEERMGEWFRVLAPTGSRAYIRADLVSSPDVPLFFPKQAPRPTPPAPPAKVVAVSEKSATLEDTKTANDLITRTDDDSVSQSGRGQVSEEELSSPQLEDEERRALEILQRGIAGGAK